MDAGQPFVSVIIPHLNDHDRLAICLRHLQTQSYPATLFEVIVVDNGSTRPIDDVLAGFPGVKGVFESEKGCGTARNRGVLEAKGEIFAFTDSDCRPDRDWLKNAVSKLRSSKADIVGGDIKVFCANEAHPTDVELFDKVFGFEQKRYIKWKNFAAGANIVTSRTAFSRIGPFHNDDQPEDLEWGRRAVKMGCRIVFAADAIIRHPARKSWGELSAKIDRTVRHSGNYIGSGRFHRLKWLVVMAALASPPLVKMWILMTTPDLSRLSHRLRAMRCLFRVRFYRIARMMDVLRHGFPIRQDKLA